MKNLYKNSKKAFIVMLLATMLLPHTISYAQDLTTQSQSPVIQDVDGLRAEFKEYTQSPATKKVKYEMVIKSNIDSDRVRIAWTVTGPSAFEAQDNYSIDGNTARRNISIRKGQTYVIPIEVTVATEGITELFGRVEAFLAESTYIATVRKNFASNKEGEVLPLSNEYNQAKTMNTILNIVVILIAVAAILAALFYVIKLFIKWLDKDERDLNS